MTVSISQKRRDITVSSVLISYLGANYGSDSNPSILGQLAASHIDPPQNPDFERRVPVTGSARF